MTHLFKSDSGEYIIRDDWYESDIHDVADNMGIKITADQAYKVMQIVVDGYDANDGISWLTISWAIDQVVGDE